MNFDVPLRIGSAVIGGYPPSWSGGVVSSLAPLMGGSTTVNPVTFPDVPIVPIVPVETGTIRITEEGYTRITAEGDTRIVAD